MIESLALLPFRVLMLCMVGLLGLLGFIMLAPFPSFWRELVHREDRGYAKEKT